MMAIHYEKLSIKAHLHCDKTIKANKLSYAWFCYWKAFDWKIEIWLNSVELKGIWLEKLKFGWTLMNNGWLWNLVEILCIERYLTGKIETWTRDAWLLKFGWNLMYWNVSRTPSKEWWLFKNLMIALALLESINYEKKMWEETIN